MTNLEVIKLFADKDPMLLVEIFDDCYSLGFTDGGSASIVNDELWHETAPQFSKEWANQEYDTNIFRPQDIERLLASEN